MHPPSLAAGGDDSRAAEVGQVTRDFRLADSQDLHKVADANFLVGDQIEQAKARAIGEGAKEKIDGERLFLPRHGQYYIWIDRYGQ